MKIEIRNLSKTFSGSVKALNGIHLELEQGLMGLLGPNGAGKSTLMRILAGIHTPDEGSVLLDNVDVTDKPEEIKKRLGYLPQDFGVYPKVSAMDLLIYVGVMKGISKGVREMAEYLLNTVNLYEHRNRYVYDFSGGMRQRFGIAQALMGDPDILIVDEPTAGLDPTERNRFHNILAELAERKIVLFSTHIVQDITELCRYVAILHQGKIHYHGKPEEAIHLIKGKIYEKPADYKELHEYEKQYQLLSKKLKYGQLFISIYSEEKPDPSFSLKENPDLEDVFFFICNTNHHPSHKIS